MALPEEFVQLAKRVSNWGRWGDDDERGTLNLVDAGARRRGLAAARRGDTFPLAIPLSEQGPQTGAIPGRLNPLRTMVNVNIPYTGEPAGARSSEDVVVMGLQAATHWDALAHCSYDGFLYNGFPADTITAEHGAQRCGIDKVGAVVTRGVLLDVAAALGVEMVEDGTTITPVELDAACERQRVEVAPGDVVLVRTGVMRQFRAGSRKRYLATLAGLTASTAEWFHARDVAAVATDNLNFEAFPGEFPEVFMSVHMLFLRDMGLLQGQNWDLEALAADCAADGVYEFLLSATPEPFVGGLGSPVNPVAVK